MSITTRSEIAVLAVLGNALDEIAFEEILDATKLRPGILSSTLRHLENEQLLECRFGNKSGDINDPVPRFYKLTAAGEEEALAFFNDLVPDMEKARDRVYVMVEGRKFSIPELVEA